MVTHFLSESGQAACGRGDSNVNGSSDVGQVSCKTCRRTNAFAQAQENAAPASAPVTPTAAAPVIDKAAPRKPRPGSPPRSARTAMPPARPGRRVSTNCPGRTACRARGAARKPISER